MRLGLLSIAALAATGCIVDRTLTVNTKPDGVSAVVSAPMAATSEATSSAYVVVAVGKGSAQLTQSLAKLGTVTGTVDELGLAFVTSADPAFVDKAVRLAGVQGVSPDPEVQWVKPESDVQMVEQAGDEAPSAEPHAFGGVETFRGVQWAPDAVHAVEAWDAGIRGAGARVAVLDGGIHNTHIDIASQLDAARSKSFVPNQPYNFDQARNAAGQCVLNDTFWHGTHVAGIIAAPGQNIGTVGIAPEATIIGVKVLHCGSGSFSQVINGIIYAATPISEGGAGADIINMSLGALVQIRSPVTDTIPPKGARGVAHLVTAIGRATTYAYQRGVLVVASAGNDALDIDHSGSIVSVPAMSPHVLSVSATGPLGWAMGATNLDRPASYTNFGQSAIGVAGPGGDFVLPGNAVCQRPRFPSGVVNQLCWVLDMVMAPCRGSGASISSYCWAAGTSMSAPAVAGVAALIVGK